LQQVRKRAGLKMGVAFTEDWLYCSQPLRDPAAAGFGRTPAMGM